MIDRISLPILCKSGMGFAMLLGVAWSCPKYDKDLQFGSFTTVGCRDTKARVLIRDSKIPVTFRAGDTCAVDSGLWIDPYSGDTLKSADEMAVDNLVPLYEAYKSGAWAWTFERRNAYLNAMDSDYQLLSVKADMQSSKGDRDAAHWLPPDTTFIRKYALDWLKVKADWQLSADPVELLSLHEVLHYDSTVTYPGWAFEKECSDTGEPAAAVLTAKPRAGVGRGMRINFIDGHYLINGKRLL